MRKPRRPQQQKQILLGDPQFHMLPGRAHPPTLRARQLRIAEHVVARVPVENPPPVHPRPQAGGHRHIRARGHDAGANLLPRPLGAADFIKLGTERHFVDAGERETQKQTDAGF